MTITAGRRPFGRIPLAAITDQPVSIDSPPLVTGNDAASQTTPTTRNTTRAATLMIANQNSISPKTLTASRFTDSTTARATSASSQSGAEVNALQ
jgi:hypothetical protein